MDCNSNLPGVVMLNTCLRSGAHDKALQAKQRTIQDAIDFLVELQREISGQQKWLDAANAAGIVAAATVITSAIIRDAVKVTPKNPVQTLIMLILGKIDDKAKSAMYDSSRYKNEIDDIDKVAKVLKEASGKTDKFGLVDLFANMAKNNLVLVGFAQDGQDAKATMRQSLSEVSKNIAKMQALLRDIQSKLLDDSFTDDSDSAQPKAPFTPAKPQPAAEKVVRQRLG